MSNLNVVAIAGNLTRDPEPRTTASGSTILNFSVAVNDGRKNQQTGEWEDVPNFIDCVCFGNRAQSLAGILRKGMKVTVGGKLRWSQWEDKSGGKRSKVEVIAESIELPPRQGQPAPQAYAPAPMAYGGGQYPTAPVQQYAPVQQAYAPAPVPQQAPAPVQQVPVQQQMYDEDIPF